MYGSCYLSKKKLDYRADNSQIRNITILAWARLPYMVGVACFGGKVWGMTPPPSTHTHIHTPIESQALAIAISTHQVFIYR